MTLEILSIGNELLSGRTVNTNASLISRTVQSEGFTVDRITVLPDETALLKAGIEAAMKRCPFVITTGGLGPTGDDLTRDVVAEIFGAPLIFNEEIYTDLIKRYGPHEAHRHQATVPKGAQILWNHLGTAPGFILKNATSSVIVLPGVPAQMKDMLRRDVLSFLKKEATPNHKQQALFLCLLSESAVDPYLRTLEKETSNIQIGICPSYGTLSIYLSTQDPKQDLQPLADKIAAKFSPYFFSTTSNQIETALHETLIARRKTLALAESCTGGKMAARLTAISGASDYFLGSIVSYSNRLKESALDVSAETLEKHGAVSQETVTEMVQGTLKLTGADYAIAVSGVAGPTGGTKEKPVGTVWGAIGEKDGSIYTNQFAAKGKGRRDLVIDYSATFLFSMLWRYLSHQIPPFEHI